MTAFLHLFQFTVLIFASDFYLSASVSRFNIGDVFDWCMLLFQIFCFWFFCFIGVCFYFWLLVWILVSVPDFWLLLPASTFSLCIWFSIRFLAYRFGFWLLFCFWRQLLVFDFCFLSSFTYLEFWLLLLTSPIFFSFKPFLRLLLFVFWFLYSHLRSAFGFYFWILHSISGFPILLLLSISTIVFSFIFCSWYLLHTFASIFCFFYLFQFSVFCLCFQV